MNKRNLQPNELDRIGRKLIDQDVISENDIENIVGSAFLYSSVRNRILADAASTGTRFGFARYLVFAGSSLVVLFGIFATVSYLRVEQAPVAAVETPKVIQIVRSSVPDGYAAKQEEQLPTDILVERKNSKRPVALQAQTASSRKTDTRAARQKRPAQRPTLEFYPVTYAGDITDAVGGHVVRVELSRQALFSMGMNIPLENGIQSIKADLLIGPDGVTRGIRLAKD